MTRLAVIGAGSMARVRSKALLATGEVMLCGVASQHRSTAEAFGSELGCESCFDNYANLSDVSPDAVLVEVPHGVQDQASEWALQNGYHVLIGGCLAGSESAARRIAATSREKGLVVEAGFESRYSTIWGTAKDVVVSGAIGRPVAVQSFALWDADPGTWYANELRSGGMPLTHMTYCYINPLRWIFGDPVKVSAFGNRMKNTRDGAVQIETCIANLLFPDSLICTLTAGYVMPEGAPDSSVFILGTEGWCSLAPAEGVVAVRRMNQGEETYHESDDPVEIQAEVFIRAMLGENNCRNTPESTIGDILVANAIAESALDGKQIPIAKPI